MECNCILTYDKIYFELNDKFQYFSLIGTFFKIKIRLDDFEIILNNGYNYCSLYFTDKSLLEEFKKWFRLLCISTKFEDKYEKMEKVGMGAFASVYKVKNKQTGRLYAAKIFDTN